MFPEPTDPRSGPREELPGLAAYFWTGGVSVQHPIRDVGPTGLYLITGERWYLGTVVRMTLIDSSNPAEQRSISVNTRVVRYGKDGVGLEVLFESQSNVRPGFFAKIDGLVNDVDQQQFALFLERIRRARI